MFLTSLYDPGWDAGYAAGAELAAGIGTFLLVIWGVFILVALLVGAVFYVLQSIGVYTIAKRRGIRSPWLSWVPVGNMWILGCIADQYQYVAKKKVTHRRTVLLGMTIGLTLVVLAVNVAQVATLFSGSGAQLGAYAAGSLMLALVSLVLSVVAAVFQYIAMYDLFASCDPGNALLFLLLSIFVSVSYPILLFICRNKDMGMPARTVIE